MLRDAPTTRYVMSGSYEQRVSLVQASYDIQSDTCGTTPEGDMPLFSQFYRYSFKRLITMGPLGNRALQKVHALRDSIYPLVSRENEDPAQ